MISTNEVVSKDANHHDNSSNIRPASTVNNSFRNQKMIKQFAQTLIFIVLIFVASFFRDVIKQEKIRKKERAEMASQIAHQNYLLEQERFLVKHREFLSTFLQYEHHCNKIHALLYKNPCGLTKGSTSAEGNNECTTGIALNETSCVSSKFDRRSSVPATMGHNQYLLKDTIDFRRQSFEALNEEDENCSPETKKHRLIRR
ncbi:uncharacterized protein LOC134836459 isoform X2 [Culicoides brevitarsis]|uniref:uncharacterized protein LOC134836459 isoform X2 n=1 Tax=Culicoides brevitarsis TaxID=469753 RepID=UPI00307BBCB1